MIMTRIKKLRKSFQVSDFSTTTLPISNFIDVLQIVHRFWIWILWCLHAMHIKWILFWIIKKKLLELSESVRQIPWFFNFDEIGLVRFISILLHLNEIKSDSKKNSMNSLQTNLFCKERFFLKWKERKQLVQLDGMDSPERGLGHILRERSSRFLTYSSKQIGITLWSNVN